MAKKKGRKGKAPRMPLATGATTRAGIKGRQSGNKGEFNPNPNESEFVDPKLIRAWVDAGDVNRLERLWENRYKEIKNWQDAARVFAKLDYLRDRSVGQKSFYDLENHPEIILFRKEQNSDFEIFRADLSQPRDPAKEIDPSEFLTLDEVNALIQEKDLMQLKRVWSNRDVYIEFKDDAISVLAAIRYLEGSADRLETYADLSDNTSIPDLPMRPPQTSTSVGESFPQQYEKPTGDKKTTSRNVTDREGQARFRQDLIDHYGCSCMVSGETVERVIEAAHIEPFDGAKTNYLGNGLLLRVDLHRLFDSGLLAVEPHSHKIHLHPDLAHSSYGAYHGKTLALRTTSMIDEEVLQRRFSETAQSHNSNG